MRNNKGNRNTEGRSGLKKVYCCPCIKGVFPEVWRSKGIKGRRLFLALFKIEVEALAQAERICLRNCMVT